MRICPDCHNLVGDQARFCDNCGFPFSQSGDSPSPRDAAGGSPAPLQAVPSGTCSACGFINVPGEMFCQNCGVQLAPVISTPPPPPSPVPVQPPEAGKAAVAKPGVAPEKCPSCGYKNRPGEVFCQNCGLRIQSPAVSLPVSSDEDDTLPSGSSASPLLQNEGSGVKSPGRVTGRLVVSGANIEINLPPDRAEVSLGRVDTVRNAFPDVDLTPCGAEKYGVSRLHARLVAQGSKIFIEDLNSTNFTFLNQQRIPPGQRFLLNHGDEIRLGLLTLKYLAH